MAPSLAQTTFQQRLRALRRARQYMLIDGDGDLILSYLFWPTFEDLERFFRAWMNPNELPVPVDAEPVRDCWARGCNNPTLGGFCTVCQLLFDMGEEIDLDWAA